MHPLVTALASLPALLLFLASAAPAEAQSIFINEIHYDTQGGDSGEAVEIAGPAGTDLSGWSLVFYNGSNGARYRTADASGTLAASPEGSDFGFLTVAVSGIQNGDPDGVALVDADGAVVQFLSYEGTFTASGGPADGTTSTDIGVAEDGAPEGTSLQLTGSGDRYGDFTWAGSSDRTYGAPNNGQTFSASGSESVEVTFAVDMEFEPLAEGEAVGVRGSLAPLSPESTVFLADSDGDGVWTGTVSFDAGLAGKELEYKFVHHDQSEDPTSSELEAEDGIEDRVGSGDDGARTLTIPSEDTSLPTVRWNNYVACTTGAPLYVSAFSPATGSVTVQNASSTQEVGLPGCTLAVFDPYTERVTSTAEADDRLAASESETYTVALPPGPGAFALTSGSYETGDTVEDVLGTVVAAVVYDEDGEVFGECGNGGGRAACDSEEGAESMAAAIAALFGGSVGTEDDGAVDLTVTAAPNPSRGRAAVSFGVAEAADVRVAVYDALGREVAVLADGPRTPGRHRVDLDGARLPAGVYVVRVAAGGRAEAVRLTVVR